ncbi:MAG: LUD domain-containing protein [Deltaproteobacteria bacterium]|nr:LUD domain-containing protein [Candidatus Zymogenaceae bacterium]
MTDTSIRDSILKRLRSAPSRAIEPKERIPVTPSFPDPETMIASFGEKLALTTGILKRASGKKEAAAAVVEALNELGAKSVLVADEEPLASLGIPEALKTAKLDVTSGPIDAAAHREACITCDAGVTTAQYGIAETGTLAMIFGESKGRLTSLVPFIHVAVLEAKNMLPHTEALFERMAADGHSPRAMSLVTGPSMTADIALTPVRGIHGPGKLAVVIVE